MLTMIPGLIPVYFIGEELPLEGTFYVVAGNGFFLHKDLGFFKQLVQVESIPVLPDLEPGEAICELPPIPSPLVYKTKKFFEEVFRVHQSEACVIVHYNKVTNDFFLEIPQQRVTSVGVNYHRGGEVLDGYLPVGTIHSHCNFDAFHSGTDDADEASFDGLHCTFGHNDQDMFSITASVVINGSRTTLDPMKVLRGIQVLGQRYVLAEEENEEWLAESKSWLDKVQYGMQMQHWESVKGQGLTFIENDVVDWADHVGAVWRTTFGSGPFTVSDVCFDTRLGEMVAVQIPIRGRCSFGRSFFKKVIS
jgi:hypothetical protein